MSFTEKEFVIKNGPGRWILALSMFEPGKTVSFETHPLGTGNCVIQSVSLHGSPPDLRTSFLVKGYFDVQNRAKGSRWRHYFRAYYDINTRKGTMWITERKVL